MRLLGVRVNLGWMLALSAKPDIGNGVSLASASPTLWKLEGLGAHAAFMTPVATPPNLMIYGPGGYQFGDFWKLG